ncbi:hypothetical protein [Scytonema sp. UIC 10036]|nr:hypothetical protein [Scytonema sp. UIC 10036]
MQIADYYALEGFDWVKVKTFEKQGANFDYEYVKTIAIDLPDK